MGVYGIYTALYNDLKGDLIVFFKGKALHNLLDLAKNKNIGVTRFIKSSQNKALIRQIGYATFVPFLNSFNKMLDLNISFSVPIVIYNQQINIVDFLKNTIKDKEKVFFIKTVLDIEGMDMKDDILVVLKTEEVLKLINILKKKVYG